jgi:hypothetical protein
MQRLKPTQLAAALLGVALTGACSYDTSEPSPHVASATAPLSNAFESCDPDQISTIQAALSQAYSYSLLAMNDIGQVGNGGDSTLFDTWFGNHSDYVFETVDSTFAEIVDVFETATFVCACSNPPPYTFGQTQIFSPGRRIELCPDYFTGDFEEVRIGALFHEASHVAGTDHFISPRCVEGDHKAWPKSVAEGAAAAPGLAAVSAEPYRLYALRWNRDRRSTFDDACP